MAVESLSGVWTALVTPFNEAGEVDYKCFQALVERQRDAGVVGVVPCGTTGESPTLTSDEKKKLIQICLDVAKGTSGKFGVIAGTGSNNTRSSVEFSRWASDAGCDGVLIVCPYYNKPSQAGLKLHFEAIANAVNCHVVVYHIPGRTSVRMEVSTILELLKHPRIRGLKEATGTEEFSREILTGAREAGLDVSLLCGDDPCFLPILSVGGCGIIAVASNLLPKEMVAIDQAAKAGDWGKAKSVFERLCPFLKAGGVEVNPVPIKRAMAEKGLCKADVRLPLAPLRPESEATLLKSMSISLEGTA